MKYRLVIDYDHFPELPDQDGSWKLVSFNRRHINFVPPASIDQDDLKEKIDKQYAFMLQYFEHGGSLWSFDGQGPQDRFDCARQAGILYWEGGDDVFEKREYIRPAAQSFLDTYNCWSNGEVYCYQLYRVNQECCSTCGKKQDDELIDSSGGYYGNDVEYMLRGIAEIMNEGDEVSLEGEAAKSIVLIQEFLKPALVC